MRNDSLIGTDEASKICRVHRATFLRWVDEGAIEPVHEGAGPRGAKLFNRADVLQLAADRARATAEATP
jgi:hypothetical protein